MSHCDQFDQKQVLGTATSWGITNLLGRKNCEIVGPFLGADSRAQLGDFNL